MLPRAALAIAAAIALVAIPQPVLAARAGPDRAGPAPPALATDEVPVPAGSSVAPLPAGTTLRLAFTLAFSNASGLASYLVNVSDPSAPAYRHFLSYAAFGREFGPSGPEVTAVEETLRSAGASSVALAPGGVAVDATLDAGVAERLLGLRLVRFSASMFGTGFTAQGAPQLPASLLGRVVGIDGLAAIATVAVTRATLDETTAPVPVPGGLGEFIRGNGTDGADWFVGSDYAQAYGATELLPGNDSVADATFPQGVAVATLLASGYNVSAATTLPPWTPTVVDDYFHDTFPPSWPFPTITGVPVPESGAPSPPLPGSFGGLNDSTGYSVENSLDLEMAGSLAPGASLYNFYFAGSLGENRSTSSNVPAYLSDDLGAALSYDYGPAHLAVVSCSFGLDDLDNSQWDSELEVAAAMGVTVVASSGDEGDAPSLLTGRLQNQWPLWPATASFNTSGTISVGGVTLTLSGTATGAYTSPPLAVRYDPNVSGIASAVAWWDGSRGFGEFAGTEGGTSRIYAEPWWQVHSAAQPPIVHAVEVEGFDQLGRAGPDVAFPANGTITYTSAAANGTPEFAVLGGTSVAAPVLAGLLADVVAVENATVGGVSGLGFLDPELYRIASFYAAHPGSSDPFLDVVSGSNALFSAGPGWDATTGWGGVSAPFLLAADENSTVAGYAYTGPTPTLPAASPALSVLTVVVICAGGAGVVLAAHVVLSRQRGHRAARILPVPAYGLASHPPRQAPPPTRSVVATFSCPYCNAERPAEPGRCPTCGAM